MPLAAMVGAAGCLLAAIVVWNLPRTRPVTKPVSYRQEATLGYSGVAPAGAAYADGHIRTGDPVFTKLVDRVDIDLDYDFAAARVPDRTGGTYDVVAQLSSATGWKRDLVLVERQPFSGDRLRLSAPLDLRRVRELQARFNEETGLATNAVSLQVVSRLHSSAEVSDATVESDLAPKLSFQLTAVEMMPTVAVGDTTTAPSKAAVVAKTGTLAVRARGPAEISVLRVHLPGEVARLLAVLLIAAAFAIGAAVLAADRRRTARGELAWILNRYEHVLVGVDEIGLDGRPVVKVSSIRALVRLARGYETLIVHARQAGGHRFVLLTDVGTAYCYDLTPAPAPPQAIAVAV